MSEEMDVADVTIASQARAWWFYETEYRDDMVIGPFASEADVREGVRDFYEVNNPFGSGKTKYAINHVARLRSPNADGSGGDR